MSYAQTPPRPKVGIAVTSLVLGIGAFLCLGPLLGIPALICGIVALSRASRNPDTYGGRGLAVIGIITSAVASLIWIAGLIIFLALVVPPRAAALRTLRQVDIRNVEAINNGVRQYLGRNGRYPRDLGASFQYCGNPASYIGPKTGTTPISPPFNLTDPSFGSQLDSHCDYAYIAADLPRGRAIPGNVIVVYSNTSRSGGRAIGFVDGHTEFVEDKNVERYFEASNRSRVALSLPEVALDGAPPVPGPEPVVTTPPSNIQRNPIPQPPQPPPQSHVSFTDVDDALKYLSSARPEERNASFSYLEKSPVTDATRRLFAPRLEQLLDNNEYRSRALNALKTWGTADNAPAVRTWLQKSNPNEMRGEFVQSQTAAIALLVQWKDQAAAPDLAKFLRSNTQRATASDALLAFGSASEDPLLPLVADTQAPIALEALKILAKVGTEKSLLPIHRALYSPVKTVPDAASDTLKQLATLRGFTPEKYLYVLIDRYKIEAPAGFTAAHPGTPNVRTWTRTAPGRAVKSIFSVVVTVAPPNFRLPTTANPVKIDTGTLTLQQIALTSTNFDKTARYQALDGDYLLDLTASADNFDTSAQTSLTNAAKKIQTK